MWGEEKAEGEFVGGDEVVCFYGLEGDVMDGLEKGWRIIADEDEPDVVFGDIAGGWVEVEAAKIEEALDEFFATIAAHVEEGDIDGGMNFFAPACVLDGGEVFFPEVVCAEAGVEEGEEFGLDFGGVDADEVGGVGIEKGFSVEVLFEGGSDFGLGFAGDVGGVLEALGVFGGAAVFVFFAAAAVAGFVASDVFYGAADGEACEFVVVLFGDVEGDGFIEDIKVIGAEVG
jgi:hypothetical protein